MSSLLRFIDELAEEEDDELIEVLKAEYWHFLFVAMVFPRWKKRLTSYGLVLFYLSTVVFHLGMFLYSIYFTLLEHEWEVVSISIHLIILILYSIYQPLNFNYMRKHIADLHRTLAKDVGIYCSGRIYDDQACIDFRTKIRLELRYYMILPVISVLLGGILLTGLYFSKWYADMEHPYSPNGLSLKLPLTLYYPFPTDKGTVHYVIVCIQLIVGAIVSFLFMICEVVLLNIFSKLKYELRVIGYSIDTLITRSISAMGVYENDSQKEFLLMEDAELQRSIEKCLKETIIHHQKIFGLMLATKTNIKYTLAVIMILGLLVIGISLMNMLVALKANYIGLFVIFGLLLCGEIQAQFLICLIGTSLTEEMERLRNKIYTVEWYCFDMKNRRILLNFQACFAKPFVLAAGGVTVINMATFSWILSSAYKFFNVMRSTNRET